MVRKDGRLIDVRVNSSSITDEQGNFERSICIIDDITERKLTEDRVRLLLDNLPCVAMILKKGTREIVASNSAARSVGAIPGTTCYQTCAKRQESCTFCRAPEMWESNETRDIEVEYNGVWYHGIWVPLTDELYVHYIFNITERKRADMKLHESEENYRSLIANIPDVVWTTDENGHTTFISDNISEVYGYTPEEIYQGEEDVWMGRIHPEDIDRVRDGFGAIVKDDTPFDIEYRIQRKDGRWIWLHDRALKTRNDQGIIRVDGVFTDITERKLAEEALCKSEQRYGEIVNSIPGAVYQFLRNKEGQFSIPFMSNTFEEIAGVKSEILVQDATKMFEYIHPDDHEGFFQSIEQSAQSMSSWEHEFRVITSEKKTIWIKGSSNPVMIGEDEILWNGVLMDITVRKQAEYAVTESERKLSFHLQNTPVAAIEWNHDFEVVEWNIAAEKIFGFSKDEALGQHAAGLIVPESARVHVNKVWGGLMDNKGGFHSTNENNTKDGRTIICEWNNTPLVDQSGKVSGVASLVQDITQRKRIEEALQESERKYKHLFESMLDGFALHEIICDDSGKPIDYRFLAINPAFEQLTGLKAAEMLGKRAYEALPGLESYWIEKYGNVALTGEPIHFDNYSATLGKHFEITAYRPAPGQFACIFTDITSRKKAEEGLKSSEEFNRAILENSPIGVSIRSKTGQLLNCNKAWQKIWGRSDEDIQKLKAEEITELKFTKKTDYLIEYHNQIRKVYEEGGYFHVREAELLYHKAGGRRWVSQHFYAIKDENNQVDHVVILTEDITDRKRAEEALLEGKERYRAIWENSTTGICLSDKDGVYHYVNPAYCKLYGYSNEQLIGRPFYDLIVRPEEKEYRWKKYIDKFNRGKPIPLSEAEFIKSDGEPVCIQLTGDFVRENKIPKYLVSMNVDITARKRAEDALHDSENKLLEAQRIAQMGHYILNVKTGHWTASSELDNIFGIDEDYNKDMAGWLHIVHPDHRETMMNYFQDNVLSQHCKFDKEYKIVDVKTGQEKWVYGLGSLKFDEDRNPIEMFGTIQDITERMRAEEALHESEKSFRRLFEHSNDPIFVHSIEGKILDVNTRACEMLGYNRDKLLSMTIQNLHPEGELGTCIEAINATRQDGSTVLESLFLTADGSVLNVSISSKIVDPKQGIIQGIVRDITETKRLQALEARAARLEMAGTIAGQVAHDFNNLLAPIMAYPDLIRDELPHDHNARAFLDDIEGAANKIADINQDLMTMGRRGHYNQEVLDLNRIVLHAVKEMESQTSTMTCEMDLCEDLMSIKGGSAQIHRMITNLLVNAQDAMEKIGQVTIKTENYYADDTSIAFGRVPKGEYIKLTVSDKGCGIPDDIIEKILDPFFSTKTADRERGSGLGLSVVDAVMKDHNGYLDLDSKIGNGTSFFLYFPVTREDTGENETEHSARGGTETILVVDDDDIQRNVSTRLLTKLGYRVSSVESGEKAIEFLQVNPQNLLLLDMVMPGGIDGAETYQRILEFSPHQKAIILSGFSESDRVLEAQKSGAGAFVRKPVTKSVIAAAIRTELDRKVEGVTS
ncbi:MAG: PAS domain S-box protein [candidate division Zixibacteria bacterium]